MITMWDPYAQFQTSVLANGLTVYAAEWPGRPWQYMDFVVHSGAEQDPLGLEGLAHFVEHLVGSNAPLTNLQIEALCEEDGGFARLGSTGNFDTTYRFKTRASEAGVAARLKIFGAMLFQQNLVRQVEEQRQIILSEYSQRHPNLALAKIQREGRRQLYDGWWLGRALRPLGTQESIQRIDQMSAQQFYDQHYVPANLSVVCLGGLSLERVVKLLEGSPFAVPKPGVRTPIPTGVLEYAPPASRQRVIKAADIWGVSQIERWSFSSTTVVPGRFKPRAVARFVQMFEEHLTEQLRHQRAATYSIGCNFINYRHFYEVSFGSHGLPLEVYDEVPGLVLQALVAVAESEARFHALQENHCLQLEMYDSNGDDIIEKASNDLSYCARIQSLSDQLSETQAVTWQDIQELVAYLNTERWYTEIFRP